jgi:hypothetical protein
MFSREIKTAEKKNSERGRWRLVWIILGRKP